MHWYLEGSIYGMPAVYPQVLGHEPAGEVVAVGRGRTQFKPGDRISIEPTVSCGRCEWCLKAAAQQLCRSRVSWARRKHPDCCGNTLSIPANNATLVPESFNYTQASLIEPLAVIMHMLELVEIRAGEPSP